MEFCETTHRIKCWGWLDGGARTAKQRGCVPGDMSLAVSHDADNGASQKWGWRTGEGLSLYTFLVVRGFVMIIYYLGNEKIKIKRIRWETWWFACNVVLRTLFTLSPIFSLLRILWLSYAEQAMGIDYSFDSWNNSRDNEEPTPWTMPSHTLPAARQTLVQVLEQLHLIYLPLPRKEPSYAGEFSKIIEAYLLFKVLTSFSNLLIF